MAGCLSGRQSTPRSPDEISEEEKNSFKLIKMAYSTARLVLFTIFKWGTLQHSGQTVEEFLLNTKGYSHTDYRKWFDASQRQKMSDKSMEIDFDVTHLFKLMYHVCDKLDLQYTGQDQTRLECLLKVIKDFRNTVSHSKLGIIKEELILKATKLMEDLEKALTVAGNLYNQDTSEVQSKITEMKEDIENIWVKPLVPSDLSQSDEYYELLLKVLKDKGSEELKLRYKNSSQVDPVSFLAGKSVWIEIGTVFTKIEVESAGTMVKGKLVPCDEIIEFCCNSSITPGPEVHLIEGPAGSGKTTLLKYIKDQWTNPTCSMKQLDEFNLLLVMNCRSYSLTSFSDFLSQLLPNTSAKYFREGDLQKFVLGRKTLLLVDGLDELNSSSEKLFREILELKTENLVVLCTSRPEKIPYFQLHVTTEFQTTHLKISGIADDRKEEFVVKYHNEMLKVGLSVQDTEKLLQYMRKSLPHLQSHFRLPLNLVFLVWLWANDPFVMNAVTTSSELYLETLKLMKKKLIERLMHNETTKGMDLDELNEKVTVFVTSMCQQALISLRWDMIEKFQPESVIQMKAVCDANKLPPKEVMSAFLVINTVDGEEQISFPHKLMQEFYASLWIRQTLFDENREADDSALMQDIAETLGRHQLSSVAIQNVLNETLKQKKTIPTQKPGAIRAILTDLHKEDPYSLKLPKYQSLLVQVAGVLYAHDSKKVEECTAVEIVQLLKEALPGDEDVDEWFILTDYVKNDKIILKQVSRNIRGKDMTITEDHIEAALVLLDDTAPGVIIVEIFNKSGSILSHFEQLIEKISKCKSRLWLYFSHDYIHPSSTPGNDEQYKFAAMRCSLDKFRGHVSGEALLSLPHCPSVMYLAISSDEQAAGVMKYLHQHVSRHNDLGDSEYLRLHITSAVSSSSLCQMPCVGSLYLSDVDDAGIKRVCEIAAKLLPPKSPKSGWFVFFPHAQVTEEGWKQLLTGLWENKCVIGYIYVPEEVGLTVNKFKTLRDMARSLLGCEFRRWSEDYMWRYM